MAEKPMKFTQDEKDILIAALAKQSTALGVKATDQKQPPTVRQIYKDAEIATKKLADKIHTEG